MTAPVEYLDVEDVLALAEALLGRPVPIRDVGLLGSAVARPQTTVFGSDAYPDVWSKAAALLVSIVNNHALFDGNKRLGWLSTAVFLEINGHSVAGASNEEVYRLVMGVAAGHPPVEEVADALEQLTRGHPVARTLISSPRLPPATPACPPPD